MGKLPVARKTDLVIEELSDETLVYDLNTKRAHCLNPTAASIWKNCDGQNSVAQIATSVERELGSPVSEEVVWLGLEQLASYRLLDNPPAAAKKTNVSRRQLMKKLGLAAAVSLPIIISITAPTAHAQASDPCVADPRGPNCPCSIDSDCDSGNCNAGTCGPEL
jgi:hypothetical protein